MGVSSHSVFRAWCRLLLGVLIPLLVASFDATGDEDMAGRQNGGYGFISVALSPSFQIAFALIFCETSVKEERGKRKEGVRRSNHKFVLSGVAEGIFPNSNLGSMLSWSIYSAFAKSQFSELRPAVRPVIHE